MQVRADQLPAALARGLRPLYLIHGDETLLAQEAADAVRAAARTAGFDERTVHTVIGAQFDWSSLLGATQALSLFASRRLIEIRIPGGKPGKDGSEALQQLAASLDADTLVLLVLPRLDRTQQSSAWFTALDGAGVSVRVDPVDRRALPQWLAQRLSAQGLQVPAGEPGQRVLNFLADRVEGNLLAAHQEISKLALLCPPGELDPDQVEAAVLDVARYDVFKLGEAVLGGQTARALRMLEGLQGEGVAAVLVHWTLAEDLRTLRRVHLVVQQGRPLPVALREVRVWGVKESLFERLVPLLDGERLAACLVDAHACDGIVKGLRQPGWPTEPWPALRHLVLSVLDLVRRAQAAADRRRPAPPRLSLDA